MAIRKFIKMYNIRKDDIDDKGNINPNAALYPLYMGQYTDNKTGKRFADLSPEDIDDKLSDVDKMYDNSTNSHPDRTVQVLNEAGDTIKTVGPDLKRGYSALAFTNKDKRHGDDYFSDWHKIDHDKDINTTKYTSASKIMDNPQYSRSYADAASDAMSFSTAITPGERHKGFYALPLIVEADDSDVINYNDVIKDNYDPTRDYLPEVQLKRIIKKAVMPNMFYSNAKAAYGGKIATFQQSMFKRLLVMDNYRAMLEDKSSSARDADALYAQLTDFFKIMLKYIPEVVSDVYDVDDTFEALADKDGTVDEALADMDLISDSMDELMSDVNAVYARCAQHARDLSHLKETAKVAVIFVDKFCGILDKLSGRASDLHDYLADMSDAGLIGSYVPDTDILKKATQKGGAFDWYDSSTYSDERLKNIYGDCRDVTLSDKQLKYIYNDFSKFKKGATQNSITKGLRGLGQ